MSIGCDRLKQPFRERVLEAAPVLGEGACRFFRAAPDMAFRLSFEGVGWPIFFRGGALYQLAIIRVTALVTVQRYGHFP